MTYAAVLQHSPVGQRTLRKRFGGRELSWILADAAARVVAEHWEDADRPIAPGSLPKPLPALVKEAFICTPAEEEAT